MFNLWMIRKRNSDGMMMMMMKKFHVILVAYRQKKNLKKSINQSSPMNFSLFRCW